MVGQAKKYKTNQNFLFPNISETRTKSKELIRLLKEHCVWGNVLNANIITCKKRKSCIRD